MSFERLECNCEIYLRHLGKRKKIGARQGGCVL